MRVKAENQLMRKKQPLYTAFQIFCASGILAAGILAPFFNLATLVNVMVVLGGTALIGWSLLDRTLFSSRYFWWCLVFFVSVTIAVLVNYKVNFFDNAQALAMSFVVLFALFLHQTDDFLALKKSIFTFANVVGLTIFVTSLAGFAMYCCGKTLWLYEYRFSGLFSNPNASSLVTSMGILLSLICLSLLASFGGSKLVKGLHIANIVLSFFMNVLANSYTGKISLLLLAVMAALFAVPYERLSTKPLWHHLLRTVLPVMAAGCMLLIISVTARCLSYVPYLPANVAILVQKLGKENQTTQPSGTQPSGTQPSGTAPDSKTSGGEKPSQSQEQPPAQSFEKMNLERKEAGNGGIDNGRFGLWKKGIQAVFRSPVFGCGPRNASVPLQGNNAVENATIQAGGLHNMFLELLLTTGIVGFGSFAALTAAVFIFLLKYMLRPKRNREETVCASLIFTLAVMFFVSNLTESLMLFSVNCYSIIFWVMLGYAVNLAVLQKKENKGNAAD